MNITGKTALEVSDSIRTLMQRGELSPGDSLPPVRALSDALGVNRNTVSAAYQRLVKAGLAVTRRRRGTALRELPQAGEQEGLSPGSTLIDLADGNPDPQWLVTAAELLAGHAPRPFLYGEATILPELRQLGNEWLLQDCPPGGDLELTHGAVDAIERLAMSYLIPGDKVAVEDPCFLGSINALRLAGMQAVGVAVDEAGMRPQALQEALDKGARAVLVTARIHNPTGCSLTAPRADALRQVLAGHPNVLVIVDDHFALLAETAYHSIIPAGTLHWALVRSVSKGLGPDLRVALVGCDAATAGRLRSRLAPGMTWVSHILQAIVALALASPKVHGRIDAARKAYARHREEMCAALQAEGIEVPRVSSGFNIWVPLRQREDEVAYRLAKRGWLVRPSSAFDVQGRAHAIRVTVSRLQPGQAVRFAGDLSRCLDS